MLVGLRCPHPEGQLPAVGICVSPSTCLSPGASLDAPHVSDAPASSAQAAATSCLCQRPVGSGTWANGQLLFTILQPGHHADSVTHRSLPHLYRSQRVTGETPEKQ